VTVRERFLNNFKKSLVPADENHWAEKVGPTVMTLTTDKITGVLKVSGNLDIESANPLREAILDCFSAQPEVAIDLAEVDACDAAGLQVLLAGRRDAASCGQAFRFHAVSPPVLETAAALGLALEGAVQAPDSEGRDAA
jgi:anti-anti-sigma factor